jgi:hypothetical protein
VNTRIALLLFALLTLPWRSDAAAAAPREAHGMADTYAIPGVALAWAVLRGTTEATTFVTLRIAADPAAYPFVAVVGIDPFTQQRKPVLPAIAVTGNVDVRVARTHFADFPRTELKLYDSAAAAQADAPALVVYYVGVPDTTPELATAPAQDAYLAERIARERTKAGIKGP